jgi:Ser/Thr protein kinase RdoA (MazF antagonist)
MSLTASGIASIITKNCETQPEKVECINGGVNTVAKIDFTSRTVIFKANTFSHLSNKNFFIEYYLQKQIYKKTQLTPKPLQLYTTSKGNPAFMLMEYIPTDSPPAASTDIAYEMGRLLGQLHSKITYKKTGRFSLDSNTQPRSLSLKENEWDSFATERMNTVASQTPPNFFTQEVKKIQEKLQDYHFTVSGSPTIGHMDFRPENVLWNISKNRTKGKSVIDWDEAYSIDSVYGQVLGEFFLTHMIQDGSTREKLRKEFRKGYRSTGNYFITPDFAPKTYSSYYLLCLLRKIRGVQRWTFRNQAEQEEEVQKRRIREDFECYYDMFCTSQKS